MTRQQWQRAGAVTLPLLWLPGTAAHAQTSRGSTGAVVELGRMTTAVTTARTLEYISTISTNDAAGRPLTLYVHAKLRRPSSVRVTVSPTRTDAPDASLIVADGQTITGYDAQNNQTSHLTMSTTGENIALPFGFAADEPAFSTVRQLFGGSPFNALLYGNAQSPLTLTRHGVDISGTLLITAQWPTDLIGQQRLTKLWVSIDGDTPRRLLIGEIDNGAEHDHYIEDFTSFTLNPTFPAGTFHWTPPTPDVTAPPPAPVKTTPKAVVKPKKAAPKKPRRHAR